MSARACLRADILRRRSLLGQDGEWKTRLWVSAFSPRMVPNTLLRLSAGMAAHGFGPLARIPTLLSFFLFGIETTPMCRIGPGLFLPHTQGTVIGAASIGANCTIYQNVTIGARELDLHFDATRRPIIEDNVVIGAGAKVIGALVVGEGAKIGSNANIVSSVPAQALALAPAAEIRLRSPKASA